MPLALFPLIEFEHSDMVIELNHLDRMQEPNLTDTSNSDQEEGVSWIVFYLLQTFYEELKHYLEAHLC